MKKILIPGKYLEVGFCQQSANYCSVTDFLIDRGYLPICSAFHTQTEDFNSIEALVASYIDLSDGVILQGGSDICPSFYGQSNYNSKNITRFRDFFELELIKQAVNKKIPIFGICRGMQLINVYFGGTLHQELSLNKWHKHSFSEYENQGLVADRKKNHTVELETNGFLYEILESKDLWVNSMHRQGVDKLGENLQIEAKSHDGLIESFSNLDKKIVAVQWHPELNLERVEYVKTLEAWLGLVE